MDTIIAGRFVEQVDADTAMTRLAGAGFERGGIAMFFVNSPGQHDLYPIGGDQDKSPGTRSAGAGAAAGAAGAATVGAAAGSLLGPAGALAGAAAGAYVGSLSGALDNMHRNGGAGGSSQEAPVPKIREAGLLIAVAATDSTRQSRAAQLLRESGGTEIERSAGDIRGGDWVNFDPLAPPGPLFR